MEEREKDPNRVEVREGELILLYHDERANYLLPYRSGERISTHLGALTLIPPIYWGMQLQSTKGVVFTILRPTHSELLTRLHRQTTVVYPKDAGFILLELGVREGGIYLEVGSGSGAFTALLAALVGDRGRIYSYDRHPQHLRQAEENLARVGLAHRVQFLLCDPVTEGFGVEGADGIFVDLPEPWQVVPAAFRALCGSGSWVSLSPTLDQAQRSEIALSDHGFVHRRLYELYLREWRIYPGRSRPRDRMIGHTAFLLTARKALKSPQVGRI